MNPLKKAMVERVSRAVEMAARMAVWVNLFG